MTALFALLMAAALPVNGVDERPRRGTFVETSLGVFTAMGGSSTFSTAQPYLGIALGREIGERAAVFLSLGIGAASASCYHLDTPTGRCLAADSFGTTFVEGGASYGFGIASRMLLGLKLVAGLTDLSPGPICRASPSDCLSGSGVPDHLVAFHLGAGLALDYDTHLDHFAVGLDALIRYTLARYTPASGERQTLGIPSLAVMPRIRYVF